MEVSFGPQPPDKHDKSSSGPRDFRQLLAYWQAREMLHESHLLLGGSTGTPVMRFLIPLRTVLVMDGILSEQVAPRLGLAYNAMDEHMSSRTEDPKLEWDGETISVTLPDKLGRVVEAKWTPTVTSVVRIREAGQSTWSPGFETPFNRCTFLDLKPDTEYQVKLTHKNAAGEGPASISTMKTNAE